MKINRSTWILLAIFVIALLAVWLLESSSDGENEIANTPTPQLQLINEENWQVETIFNIEYNSPAEKIILDKKTDADTWMISSDPQVIISTGKIQQILSYIYSLQVSNSLNEINTNLEDFGLSQPEYTITLENANHERVQIRIGDNTPTSFGYYVQVDSSIPVIVSKYGVEDLLALFTVENLVQEPTSSQ